MNTAEPPLPRTLPIQLPLDQVREFCRRNHIRRLALFGSVLREDFRPESDVDVLVEFEPGKAPGLAFFTMQDELTDMIGKKVDLNTEGDLSQYFVEEVRREAVPIYVAA